MHSRFVSLLAFLALALSLHAAPLSGTKSVGPTGNYASIGAAITDIQAQTVGGALVLELQAAYVSAVETFPLVVPALNGASAVNPVTIRPASGATALAITSAAITAATVDLNGAKFVTLDGRAGGAGTAKQLTIGNTSTSGVAVRFINEASGNTLRYLTLQGVNTGAFSGTVVFGTTTGANGNDNNTIDACDICDGASTPANGIYAEGNGATAAQNNSGNTVTNCNIFNFYRNTAVDAAGVKITSGNTDWIVAGNSFYQTVSRAGVAAVVRPIYLSNTSDNTHTVTGNFIGGSAPNAGGAAWTTTGTTLPYSFVGIWLRVGNTTSASVQGNVIRNIAWTSSSAANIQPGVWCGIHVETGGANIGTVTGNVIGSGTGTDSISVITSGDGGMTYGISSTSNRPVGISNNTIGSITTNSTTTGACASLVGIQVTATGAMTISNNTVGSVTTANSLSAATASTGPTSQQVAGIQSASSGGATVTGNTVANLNNNSGQALSAAQVRGILTSAGLNIITGNTVRNLSTSSQSTGQTVLGISQNSGSLPGQVVSQNVVHSLSSTASSADVSVTGIYYSGLTTTGPNVIARNLVHSLSIASTSVSSQMIGMDCNSGLFAAQNNMVRLGLSASGAPTAGAAAVYGIREGGSSPGRSFYHNSVYVGGTETSGAAKTFAFSSDDQSSTRDFSNNIFVNARSNSGGTGKHYAVNYGGVIVNTGGLTANNNIFFANGTGGVLGLYNNVDRTTLAAWQAATGKDAASALVNPRFVNPTGTAASVDLHLQTINPAEAHGALVAGVTVDFDGQTRASYTATDIGADAGNFIYSAAGTDLNPVISYTPLGNSGYANRALTGFATITDDGSVAASPNAPRFYYKKATEADAFAGNTSAANGWKYVSASNAASPYNFTIDYGLLTSGGVAGGDVIQYFVVAQDSANNASSSPAGAAWSASPPVQNINARPATVNSYGIGNADLSALALSSGTLTPGFTAGQGSYTANVSNGTNVVTVTPTKADPAATVTVNGTSPTTPVALNVGLNSIPTLVTASDGTTTKTYTVTVTRQTAFETWATDSGLPLDPTANGGANLLNFAFGLNPDGSSTGVITVVTGAIGQRGTATTRLAGTPNGVDFKALFGRRKNSGLTYTVQFSADLSGWENNAAVPAVIADDGLIEACTVPYPFFLSDGQKARFFRVSVQ